MLFIASMSFILGLYTKNILFNLIAIILGLYIYQYGQGILFEDYYRDKKRRVENYEKIRRQVNKKIGENNDQR